MIYRRRRQRGSGPTGYFHFENLQHRHVSGFGSPDFIRLKDEFGTVWQGSADVQDDDTVRYRFRDSKGRTISGVSDHFGIILRDQRGNSWRGYVY